MILRQLFSQVDSQLAIVVFCFCCLRDGLMDVIECSSINTGAAGGLLNQAALVGMQDIENCLNVLPWIPHIYIVGCSVFRKKKILYRSFIHSFIHTFILGV